jgi:GTP-binding protein EngB required for normal cell division
MVLTTEAASERQVEFGREWLTAAATFGGLADRLRSVANEQLDEHQRVTIDEVVERLTSRGLYVVFVGEFKRGKSSLLNALLGRRDVFPVDEDIATSIVTAVTYGDDEEAQVFIEGEEAPRSVALSAVRQFVTESCNPHNTQRVRFVGIRFPFPALTRGLTLVDTPGEGCLNVEHTAATLAILPQADAAVVLVDAVEPVTTKELEFIDVVRNSTTNMIFAMTKCDLTVDPQVMVQNLRSKLTDRYGRDGAALPIVAVSSTRLLDGLDDDDPELVEESGIGDLNKMLWQLLLQRAAAAAVTHATFELRRIVENLVVPMRAELIALVEQPARRAAMHAQLAASAGRLDTAAGSDAPWRQRIDDLFAGLGAEIEADFAAEIAELGRELDQVWLQNEELLTCPEQIAHNLVSSLVVRLNAATERMREGLHLGYAQVEQDLQLDVERMNLQAISFDPCLLDAPALASGPKGLWERAQTLVREHWDSEGIKAILRGLVGVAATAASVLAGGGSDRSAKGRAWRSWDTMNGLSECSGDLVSAAGDIRAGISSVRDSDRTTKVNRLRGVLHGYLEVNGRRASAALHDVVSGLPYTVSAEIEEQIGHERKMVADALTRMASTGDEVDPAHQAALEREVNELNEIHAKLDELDASVLGGLPVPTVPSDDDAEAPERSA